jgi:phosphonate transport system permease protein
MSKKKQTSKPVKEIKLKNGAPALTPLRTKTQVTLIFFILISLVYISSIQTDITFSTLIEGLPNMVQVIEKFFPPNFEIFQAVVDPLAETIQMAIIATTIAVILSIPLCLLGARNITTNKFLYNIVRFFLNILRTIPDILLAVIFVSLFGTGAFAGIIALIIFSIGILAKLVSETIEAVDMEPLEAMRASGANTIQVIVYGLVPQVLPQFSSFSLYVFEVNVRASVVLGLVGAGGIGDVLNNQITFYNYTNAMTVIIVIFVVVLVIEWISTKIREAIV